MANKPNIRFKGFTDDWEQRKLGEWGEFYYGRSCPKWSVTEDAITPCVRYGELYTKFGSKIDEIYSYTNMPVDNLRFSKGNEVLIPRVGEDPMDYNHCTWLSIPGVAIGEMISVFNTTQSPLFSAIMFNATLQREFAMRVEGGSVTNLYYDKLKNIDVLYPTMEEQKEIARYFSTLDHLITLHQRKCDETKKLKKFMLQKMFPKNGEKNPEIRFAGFTDDWEQRKLGEIAERVQGNDGRMNLPILTISAENGWMSQEDRFSGNIAGKEQSNYTLLHKGELSYNHGNSKLAKYGTVFSLEAYKEALVPRVYHSFKTTGGNSNFIEYYFATKLLDKELAKLISSGARMDGLLNIGFKEFMGINLKLPLYSEQVKIAEYLRNLDHLITLHQRKCDKLKLIKKFMLQNMFPKKG